MLKPKQIKCLELMVRGDMTDKEIATSINITQKPSVNGKRKIKSFKKNTIT